MRGEEKKKKKRVMKSRWLQSVGSSWTGDFDEGGVWPFFLQRENGNEMGVKDEMKQGAGGEKQGEPSYCIKGMATGTVFLGVSSSSSESTSYELD